MCINVVALEWIDDGMKEAKSEIRGPRVLFLACIATLLVCAGFCSAFLGILDIGKEERTTLKDWRIADLVFRLEEVNAGGATVGFFYDLTVRANAAKKFEFLARFNARKHLDPEDSVKFYVFERRIVVHVDCRRSSRHMSTLRAGNWQIEAKIDSQAD